MKERGKRIEKLVVRGGKVAGRDVKRGMGRARRTISGGAKTIARDAKRAGRRVGVATRHGVVRVERRLRAKRGARSSSS